MIAIYGQLKTKPDIQKAIGYVILLAIVTHSNYIFARSWQEIVSNMF